MAKSMLVNVTAEEENRVAIVDNGVLDVFEIETLSREHLKGNIYKVVVEGINPALEAAFVNYGGERAGFLPLDEVNFKLYPSRDGGAGGKGRGARIARHLEKGMEVLVQVIRDSFGNKPPTMSTYYSLAGRYLVLMPGADAAGISRKIEDSEHRERLRNILEGLTIPEGFGVIVRTAGMETSPRDLQADLEALLELWKTIENASVQVKPPALIFQERDLVIRTIRDYFTSDIEEVLIDEEAAYRRARKFFEAHMADRAEVVRLYTGDKPIFSKFNLEDQIERIYKRVVQLKSGGSISIDQTEALTAVDVNSARSSRSGSSEDTATRTNLEAAEEIARQLRLRDIGGLIVIDFIDMESSRHIRQVERAFAEAMSRDKARYDVTRISKLGLMEVSRQRIKSSKASSSFMECPTCSGDGTIRTPEAAARAAFRKIQARVVRGDISGVKVFLPPEVAGYLLNEKRDDLVRLESRHRVRIHVVPEERMKASQFEIEEIRREEAEVTPMVTADTVDQAMVSGTVPALPRPPEVQEAAPLPAPVAAEARESGEVKRRRRRRRRRGRRTEGAPGPPAGPPSGTTGAAGSIAAAGSGAAVSEDRPVFSEGPGSDAAAPAFPRNRPPETGGGLLSGAQDAGSGAAAGQPHRKRRRRRRRRGHGARQPLPGMSPQVGGGAVRWGGPAAGRHEVERAAPREAPAELAPPPAWHEASHSPRVEEISPPAYESSGSGVAADPQPSSPPAASEEKKPKRRWWRRSFRG